jgi:hypothetical protein
LRAIARVLMGLVPPPVATASQDRHLRLVT